MNSDQIDTAEIFEHLTECEKDRHSWDIVHLTRAEKQCSVCNVVMNLKQIALLRPMPEPLDLETRYEGMGHGPGGMAGTSVVYEDGKPLEHTRREVILEYEHYYNLKKMGLVK